MTTLLAVSLTSCGDRNNEKNSGKSKEMTLAIIKPDAVANNQVGSIINTFESNGLRVASLKMIKLDSKRAGDFYAVHKDRPFYKDLVSFMSSGPVVVMVLEGNDAVAKNRTLMGATNPKEAAAGTLRQTHGESMTKNAIHGSDSPQTSAEEIAFFFKPEEINNRY